VLTVLEVAPDTNKGKTVKKLFVLLAFTLSAIGAFAQSIVKEADFVGNVRVLNADSTTTNLDKYSAQVKTKATGSKIWWGIGSSKAFAVVPGTTSSSVFQSGQSIELLVRSTNNELDPTSIVQVFQYEVKGKNRRAHMGKVNNLYGNSSIGLESMSFDGKKFGKSSYIITLPKLNAGEYGVYVRNPNLENDDKNLVLYSFTVK